MLLGCIASAQYNYSLDTVRYKWMHPQLSRLQFYQRDAITPFYQAWKATDSSTCVIAHMGDSHVQPDILPGEVRKILQAQKGEGGRGFVFPYSTAATYSSVEYKSTHEGVWEYGKSFILPAKVPLGLAGMGCRTLDSNSTFTLSFLQPLPKNYTRLRIYCKHEANCYDFDVNVDTTRFTIRQDTAYKEGHPYIELTIPPIEKTLSIKVRCRRPGEQVFEFYGMDIMNGKESGVAVHSVGVGGARYQAVLYQALLPQQLASVEPDLVILDYGTNDYLYDDKIKSNLRDEIEKSIKVVRDAAPGTSILLTSTQDMYRRGRNLRSGVQFSDLIRDIAKDQHCLFFDWFWISGGPLSMKNWQTAGLSQGDMIHLSWKGAKIKGELLADAIIRTMQYLDEHPDADSLVLELDSTQKAQRVIYQKDTTKTVGVYAYQESGNAVYHKISSGENLGEIAMRYGVTVSQIKVWNRLTSDMIIAGKVLVIYRSGKAPVQNQNIKPNNNQQNQKPPTNYGTSNKQPYKKGVYTVQSGDTLWGLSKRFHTTVDAIKKANGLRSDKLSIGQKLIIP